MKIEVMAVDRLIPYARNAKLHNDSQIAAIAGSIREFGFNNPVLVDADNGIIAGHGRVLAARQLGMDEVPCIRLSHMTDNQRRAYILADNRLAEIGGGWDKELLRMELDDLRMEDIDPGSIGFDAAFVLSLSFDGNFDAGSEKDQGRLDEKNPTVCPKCGHTWVEHH